MDQPQPKPLFSFGLITDVQYADVEDAHNFDKSVLRHYRNALKILKNAVTEWKNWDLSFVVQLGDLIDQKAGADSYKIAKQVSDLFEGFQTYHLIGNHELYNLTRGQLDELLKSSHGGSSYYSFSPHPGWRFVVLDAYDLNIMEANKRKEALAYLSLHNPNDVTAVGIDWRTGLTGLQQRFLPYNGMMRQPQLDWLQDCLSEATTAKEKVVLMSHVPFVPGCSTPDTLVWNYEEVSSIVQSHSCVVACLFGHDHTGGYTKLGKVHCRTFQAPLEAPIGQDAFCVLQVYEDKIVTSGFGTIRSSVWDL